MKNNNNSFLAFLSKSNLEVFTIAQVTPFFNKLRKADYEFIEDLARNGWLIKLKNGLYARNLSMDRDTQLLPNWHKIAGGLVYPKQYYIGFYSALQIHDLITQPALREYIVTEKQVNQKIQTIHGVPFEMVYMKSDRFFGFKKTWINDHDKVFCSDLEKTIIDCLYQPQYAGGMEGISKAIYKGRNKIKANVLLDYAIKFKVQAVKKRLGYVLEKLDLFTEEQIILKELISESYTKLDPSIKVKGTFHRKWRIEDNVDFDDLRQTINT
ncbi:MAG: putative transcriptional regulator of viral defense system [Saprospiraceae bacterium]|jgi:predicted transcriptional regulator of viral defense system